MSEEIKFLTVEKAQRDLEDLYNYKIKDYLCGLPSLRVGTLKTGESLITFDHIPTNSNNFINFSTSNGINYIRLDTSVSGQVTAIYEAQENDITVFCTIEEI